MSTDVNDSAQEISRMLLSCPDLLPHSIKVFLTVGKIIDALPDKALTGKEVRDVLTAALLHDVGKSSWKKDWFVKPRYLINDDDWKQMQQHPLDGAQLLSVLPEIPKSIIRLVAEHHERPEGKGYPQQKEPEFLCILLAAADVYSACTENRAYRNNKKFAAHEAIEQVASFASTEIIEALLGWQI
ncbi:HD domain [Syntrophomonas zehnderi OL-4]|uniref:HD domain n=1 Tax=Syntrophomonas zehnderi OL-4 TaxID=690567 RepID=A0A0E4C8G0_9FIRM|nr:HD domain-containing phosphohydrolase [Syntrophomonas zehnderi]CFX47715.1 HD domain [Syntrophomonas zehnderi OL-4]